jgi:hypothetical protein
MRRIDDEFAAFPLPRLRGLIVYDYVREALVGCLQPAQSSKKVSPLQSASQPASPQVGKR